MTIRESDQVGGLTLDQIAVFLAVVDHGGFAAAARQLGRAQSAVTYAIRGLEEATGLLLFDRSTYRPTLTDAGRMLLPRARHLAADMVEIRRQAEAFSKGVEASIGLVVDPLVPLAPVARALGSLHAAFPSVQVRLHAHASLQSALPIPSTGNWIGLLSMIPNRPFGSEFEAVQWGSVPLVAVAAPTHPLAATSGPLTPENVRGHMQIVYTSPDSVLDSEDRGVHALDRWYTTDWRAKMVLIREGTGWGSLPSHIAQPEIDAGLLIELRMKRWEGNDQMPRIPIAIVRRADLYIQPAAQALIAALRANGPD
jgi:DNA-binding transcriptional LysR family regulator